MTRNRMIQKIKDAMGKGFAVGLPVGCAVVCAALGQTAMAGDVLYFKSGPVITSGMVPLAQRLSVKNQEQAQQFVVQFKNRITAEDRLNVTSIGARILRYIPDDALVVTATPGIAKTIERSSNSIQAVLPFEASWKISSEFEPASVFSADNESEVLIRLFPQVEEKSVLNQIQLIEGVRVEIAQGRSIVARIKRSSLEKLASVSGVEWVQPSPELDLLYFRDAELQAEGTSSSARSQAAGDYSDLTGFETGTKLMKLDAAWSRGYAGQGQIVAMADTGLDRGDTKNIHADFSNRVPMGFAFGLFSKSWEDPMGHGTHVAGSVMGGGKVGGPLLRGAAPEAALIPEGMWSPMLGNLTVPPKLRDLFQKPYDQGARIHTNSWGAARNFGAYDSMAQQVDEFTSANPDMLVLFAAGNSGVDSDKDGRIDPNSVGSPGTAKNVLTVGASKNYVLKGGIQRKLKELKIGQDNWGTEPLASSSFSENPQGLAAFSSRGPTTDGRIKPELVAPGTNVLSVKSQHRDADPLWGEYNKDYVWSGGTSMSTPLTAGAAAVVRQYLIENRKIANPSAALLKAALLHTATDLYPGQFGEVGKAGGQELLSRRPNVDQGFGLVDVDKATDLSKSMIIDERAGVGVGEGHSYPIRVNGRSRLSATLVYTDAPGAAGAAQALVNDLDLVIVNSATGVEAALKDRLNNSELVEVDANTGDYEIKVKGVNVPQGIVNGKQPYALLISVN